jgi:O-antigen/teichoic acid export membrane protein
VGFLMRGPEAPRAPEPPAPDTEAVSESELPLAKLVFQNVSTNYLITATEILIGIFMLPFNVSHLGQAAYGLWVLVASVTVYYSMLDMGYGWAQVKFAAKYRAQGDARALNELASTMFGVFSAVGIVTMIVTVVIAVYLDRVFPLTGAQVRTGRIVLLFISSYVALGFPVSVFGGIVNGFQRQYLNGAAAFATTLAATIANVLVLRAGYGLAELVAATTAVRMLGYVAYALNAYRVFPQLQIRRRYFRRERLREVTSFSVFVLILDVANKLNYSTDAVVIGAFMGTTAVAVWAVAQRLIDIVQRITDQLNGALFPVVVDSSTIQRLDRLQMILVQGTRLSLGMVVPMATVLGLVARPLVLVWVGPKFVESVDVIVILSVVVALRVGSSTASVILKGADLHKFVAYSNLGMAIGNVLLSVVLVKIYGLIGVALGTLIPVALVAVFVILPRACRRVELPVRTVLRQAAWPATWPAVVMGAFVVLTRDVIGHSGPLIVAQSLAAGVTYTALFVLVAISRREREWYFGKLREMYRRAAVTSAPANIGASS